MWFLEWNFVFQNFEWSLSCSVFSRQLKTDKMKSERPNYKSGKVVRDIQWEIAIRNFHRRKLE